LPRNSEGRIGKGLANLWSRKKIAKRPALIVSKKPNRKSQINFARKLTTFLRLPVIIVAVIGGLLLLVDRAKSQPSPALNISMTNQQMTLSWQTIHTDFGLEAAQSLDSKALWNIQLSGLTNFGSNFTFKTAASSDAAFFRLHKAACNCGAIVALAETWTWVPITNAYNVDGSTTGIGVNLNPASSNVLIFMNGGGACWNDLTCYVLQTATLEPYGATQFSNDLAAFTTPGSGDYAWFYDRTVATNVFKDFNYVFVPYSTGDVFAGSRTNLYGTTVTRQVGFLNFSNYLQCLVPTFPSATYVVLAGSSAGGLGAAFNWWQTQEAFSSARVDLIDDSGPILPEAVIAEGSGGFGTTAISNWNLTAAVPITCAECPTNFDSIFSFFASVHPDNRAAFLSYSSDTVMPSYYGLSTSQYNAGLSEFLAGPFNPNTNFAYFILSGSGHVLLPGAPSDSTAGVNLEQFLSEMVTNYPGWTSVHP
jgi:hypothetical protein